MYNYITTDTSSFLSDPKHVEVVIAMCKQVCIHGSHFIVPINSKAETVVDYKW